MTAEIALMDGSEARERVERVKAAVDQARADLVELWRRRAWVALGYESWDDLCDAEFAVRVALPRDDRREAARELADAGMSRPAIATAVGASVGTVHNDLSVLKGRGWEAPERVVSLDGRERPATQPARPEPPRRGLVDPPSLRDDADVQAAMFRRNLAAVLDRAMSVTGFDPDRVADLMDDELALVIDMLPGHVAGWVQRVKERRSSLRLIAGGER